MTQIKIYGKRLATLYKSGKLTNILKKYKDIMTPENFIGHGDDCSTFKYNDESNTVIKLCVKSIGYFKYHPKSSAQDFKKLVNKLGPMCLPINEVLYDDANVFIYTQPICERFDKTLIDQTMLHTIYEIEYFMFIHSITASTSSHNLGIYQGRLIIFDYHDIHAVTMPADGYITNEIWWKSKLQYLIHFTCLVHAVEQRHVYKKMAEDLDKKAIKLYKKDNLLPSYVINLLEYIANNKGKLSIQQITCLLYDFVIYSLV
jgi:hypothetical protein